MAAAHDPSAIPAHPEPHYVVDEVAALTRLSRITVYEQARRDPLRWGAVRYGRAVRFRREVIDALVRGEG